MKKDFLTIADTPAEELQELLDLAIRLKTGESGRREQADSCRQEPGDDFREAVAAHPGVI